MNPHFIFNCLNAIQLFIAQNQKTEANIYLSDFAQMMRQVLDSSSKRFISLREEIQNLELYVKLEMLRFNENIIYEIDLSPFIEPENIFLPPMLIQPLLENAFWHGLSPKKSDGYIALKFEKEDAYLYVTVTDNGVGRNHANTITKKRNKYHTPTGIKNIRERLQLEYPKESIEFLLQYEDLIFNHTSGGTKVHLRLPIYLFSEYYKLTKETA